jgi:hypothetical protein
LCHITQSGQGKVRQLLQNILSAISCLVTVVALATLGSVTKLGLTICVTSSKVAKVGLAIVATYKSVTATIHSLVTVMLLALATLGNVTSPKVAKVRVCMTAKICSWVTIEQCDINRIGSICDTLLKVANVS